MAKQNRVQSNRAAEQPDSTAPCVLVIDDDADMRTLLVYQLSLAGFRGMSSATGISGVRAARAVKPEMIILDLNLPDMHGLEVLQMLRDDATLADTRVVVVSGERSVVAAQALVGGADALFTKPLDFDDLIDSFRSLNCVAPDTRG